MWGSVWVWTPQAICSGFPFTPILTFGMTGGWLAWMSGVLKDRRIPPQTWLPHFFGIWRLAKWLDPLGIMVLVSSNVSKNIGSAFDKPTFKWKNIIRLGCLGRKRGFYYFLFDHRIYYMHHPLPAICECPLLWDLNPPKQGPRSNQKQPGQFGFQVYWPSRWAP